MNLADHIPVTRGYLERKLATMATREELEQAEQEVHQAIENERREVGNRVAALEQRIADLEQQVANGGTVTLEDLQAMRDAVRNIHTPPA